MTYKNKTIKKHARGNWFVRVRHDGKYISIYGRTKQDTYEKLKVIADKIEQEKFMKMFAELTTTQFIESGMARPKTEQVKQYTFQEWFDEWLTSYKGNLRATTIKGYRSLFEIHCAELREMKLTDITNIMLAKVLNTMAGCKQAKDQMKSILKQMFAIAHNDKLIDNNPTLNLPRPKATPPSRKRQALSPEQEQRMIEFALKDEKYEPLLICLLQGLRKGEMLALRPNDFDFGKNTLRIDESYDEQNPSDLMTKNADSNREMPMFELTRNILIKYKDYPSTERIFETATTPRLYKLFAELQEQAELPKITIHELRHTFITRCHEKGIDEMIVQRWVGHKIGSAMTKAVYTHISNDKEQEYIDQMNAKTK